MIADTAESQSKVLQAAAGDSVLDREILEKYSAPIKTAIKKGSIPNKSQASRITKRLSYAADEIRRQNNW